MAMPSGYKRLECIQSSGTQYIDTGFKPNQDTRVVVDVEFAGTSTTSSKNLFGARTALTTKSFTFFSYNSKYESTYNTEDKVCYSSLISTRFIVDKNKNVTVANGTTYTHTYAAFSCDYTMFLFATNNKGAVFNACTAKIYSCKIYDNGTLVRDFIPCQKSDGTVGMWDNVNSVFYGNAGTGTFTAGPPAAVIPDAPSELHQSMSVRIAWTAVSGATSYNVYRDGELLGSTADTAYVDATAGENEEYTYAVSAVNSAGESGKTTVKIYTRSGFFLYRPVIESANFP